MSGCSRKNVCVVVLGDIGRSPRMQYHALSLARSDFTVDLIGYGGSKPLPEILQNENINITNLVPLPEMKGPKLLKYVLKVFWQVISLLLTISFKRRSDFVLCQNPPAIPTLFVCWLYCLIARAKFIIDWHNYAFSIMALSHGKQSLIVKIARRFEFMFGSMADKNLCVTNAMKNDLFAQKKISAKVLYDRPPDFFKSISIREKHDFILKLSVLYPELSFQSKSKLNTASPDDPDKTILTECDGKEVYARPLRPGVIFSSTSWTEDEDFRILLDALRVYDDESIEDSSYPRLICVITGKGPMKDYYIEQMKIHRLRNVEIVTPWLEAADYPLMVASADLGVCLHTSSSGLDLPMKVVDMFGCGLPVCAYKFTCLDELVKEEENGYTFENSDQLSKKIKSWFKGFPNNTKQNNITEQMKENLKTFQKQRWQSNWDLRAKAIFS